VSRPVVKAGTHDVFKVPSLCDHTTHHESVLGLTRYYCRGLGRALGFGGEASTRSRTPLHEDFPEYLSRKFPFSCFLSTIPIPIPYVKFQVVT